MTVEVFPSETSGHVATVSDDTGGLLNCSPAFRGERDAVEKQALALVFSRLTEGGGTVHEVKRRSL